MSHETPEDLTIEVEVGLDHALSLHIGRDRAATLDPLTPRSPIMALGIRRRGRVPVVAEVLPTRNPNLTPNRKVLLKPLRISGLLYQILL